MSDSKEIHTQWIRSLALELGFLACGISQATELVDEARDLKKWLEEGRHGEMSYMANHFEKRTDPRKLVEGTRSVVSVLYNYYTDEEPGDPTIKISRYAYGRDYHEIVKKKLWTLFHQLEEKIPGLQGRAFVDSAPVMDKAWAQHGGLGWIGKNTNLINKHHGSYVFIGELLLNVELVYDNPVRDLCGNCTRCIDACPTEALAPYKIDGSKCISYQTIERRGELTKENTPDFDQWIFGCDVCQQVCPWNLKARPHNEPLFRPHPDLLSMTASQWRELSVEQFRELFRKSAVKRTKYQGLMRNIRYVKPNPGSTQTT